MVRGRSLQVAGAVPALPRKCDHTVQALASPLFFKDTYDGSKIPASGPPPVIFEENA